MITIVRSKTNNLTEVLERFEAYYLPITNSLLPSLQLCSLIQLKTIYPRSISFCFQCNTCSAGCLSDTLRNFRFFLNSPTFSAGVVFNTTGGRSRINRAGFRRKETGVYEEQEVREGRAKVSAINGAMARRFGRVDIFASTAIQLH